MIILIPLGILALILAFGVAWIDTRLAGLFWVAANCLAYQWAIEATRVDTRDVVMAANATLVLLIVYLSVMALSGIGAAHVLKRGQGRAAS